MHKKDDVAQLLLAVVVCNLMVLFVLAYWVNPIDFPTPIDDVAVTAGAYWVADKTGVMQQVVALLETIMKGDAE